MSAPTPIWKGTSLLVFQPETGRNVCGDRIRFTDVYRGPIQLCYNVQPPRGSFGSNNWIGTGRDRSMYVVNQSTVDSERGGIGKLTIEWEAGGAYAGFISLPVGGFNLKAEPFYPKIERHPIFQVATAITIETVELVYDSLYAGRAVRSDAITRIYGAPDTNPQKAKAKKLREKLAHGEETYYLSGWRYSFELFSYDRPTINRGGFVGTPGGPLAGLLPSNTSWLRLADDLDPAGVAGSMYKITETWIGAPLGHWDPEIYHPDLS